MDPILFDFLYYKVIPPGEGIRWGIYITDHASAVAGSSSIAYIFNEIGWIIAIGFILLGFFLAAFSQVFIAIREISINTRAAIGMKSVFYKSLSFISKTIQWVGISFGVFGVLLLFASLTGIPQNTAYIYIDTSRSEIHICQVSRRVNEYRSAEKITSFEVERIYAPNPDYPQEAIEANMEGQVKFEVAIDIDGNVTDVQFISGNDIFKETVLATVCQWKYKPYRIYGDNVASPAKFVESYKFFLGNRGK